jgi:hypothetical protein
METVQGAFTYAETFFLLGMAVGVLVAFVGAIIFTRMAIAQPA